MNPKFLQINKVDRSKLLLYEEQMGERTFMGGERKV
jgi:hypothetical protein